MKSVIQVSIRELHARTGHYLRKVAGEQRVVVTDNGKPFVEIKLLTGAGSVPYFARRKLRPEFKKMVKDGRLNPKPGDRHSTELISEERDGKVI